MTDSRYDAWYLLRPWSIPEFFGKLTENAGNAGVHALALQVSGIPLTAVATRMSAPPNHVSAWISRAVHKLRNDESFLSSLHEN